MKNISKRKTKPPHGPILQFQQLFIHKFPFKWVNCCPPCKSLQIGFCETCSDIGLSGEENMILSLPGRSWSNFLTFVVMKDVINSYVLLSLWLYKPIIFLSNKQANKIQQSLFSILSLSITPSITGTLITPLSLFQDWISQQSWKIYCLIILRLKASSFKFYFCFK